MKNGENGENIKGALRRIKTALGENGIESGGFEARLMVQKAIGAKTTAELLLAEDERLNESAAQALEKMLEERILGKPLQYILGTWEFMGLELVCDSRGLIPRQDTETLCELAIDLIKKRDYKTCLDMCCGSGCIGIALAKITGIAVDFADISPNALALTDENRNIHGIGGKLLQSDLFGEITDKYDMIVCNPPYLTKEDMAALQKELAFEPANALYGGDDGLELYRKIAAQYARCLNENGVLLLEVGAGQAKAVCEFLGGAETAKDINGIERVVIKG